MKFKLSLSLLSKPIVGARLSSIVFLLMANLFFVNQSLAQIELDVSGGEVRGIPTAIVPFKFIDGQPQGVDVADIVNKNLSATGKFDPINSQRFLTQPSKIDEVRYKDWRFIDAEVLVIGEVWKIAEDNYEIQFRMFDVAREQEVGTGKMQRIL